MTSSWLRSPILAGQDRASISGPTLLYTDASSNTESLELDSLDMLKLSLSLMETMGLSTLPEGGWEEIVTVQDLVDFCEAIIETGGSQ